jgi:hypothetical protein
VKPTVSKTVFGYLSLGTAGVTLVLAAFSLGDVARPALSLFAMALFLVAVVASLTWQRSLRMPVWLAFFNVGAAIAICLLVSSQIDVSVAEKGAAWHTTAVAILMVITSTRLRHGFAWVGIGATAVQTVVWQGPIALVSFGVVGGITWVATSHMLAYSLSGASRDAYQYVLAEREAAEWRAAREARVFERQFRLSLTGRTALPILNEIVERGADLDDAARRECLMVEDTIRDEIRGRRLLDDGVRREVMAARRRGGTVALLDEGGLDDLPQRQLERVHVELASALASTAANRIVVRTAPAGSEVAVTVVGVSETAGSGADDDEELALWLEIPRRTAAPPE